MVDERNDKSVKAGIYPDRTKLAYLIGTSGGIVKKRDFMRLPAATQQKLTRCLKILKAVPEDFITAEVRDDLQALGVGDWQRYLFMLYQAGFLRREPDVGKRLKYTKTEIAMAEESEIAIELYNRRDSLDDYETKPTERAKKTQVDVLPDNDEEVVIIMRDSDINWDEEPEDVTQKEPEPVAQVVEPKASISSPTDIPEEFIPVINAWRGVKSYLPRISVKDFLVMYIRSQDKGNDSSV